MTIRTGNAILIAIGIIWNVCMIVCDSFAQDAAVPCFVIGLAALFAWVGIYTFAADAEDAQKKFK